jgi:hypothetical protein
MKPFFLAELKFEGELDAPRFNTMVIDKEVVDSSLDKMFSNISTNIEIDIPEDFSDESYSSESSDSSDVVSSEDFSESSGETGEVIGEHIDNITGHIVQGNKSINAEKAKVVLGEVKKYIFHTLSTNPENAEKAFDISSSSTVTYNPNTDTVTLYFWYEDPKPRIVLWGWEVPNLTPYITCLSISTNGKTKKIKAFVTKELYDINNEKDSTGKYLHSNKWREQSRIGDLNETVISPATKEEYYIIAESEMPVGQQWGGGDSWFKFSIQKNPNTSMMWIYTEGFGYTLSAQGTDILGKENWPTAEDIAGGLRLNSMGSWEPISMADYLSTSSMQTRSSLNLRSSLLATSSDEPLRAANADNNTVDEITLEDVDYDPEINIEYFNIDIEGIGDSSLDSSDFDLSEYGDFGFEGGKLFTEEEALELVEKIKNELLTIKEETLEQQKEELKNETKEKALKIIREKIKEAVKNSIGEVIGGVVMTKVKDVYFSQITEQFYNREQTLTLFSARHEPDSARHEPDQLTEPLANVMKAIENDNVDEYIEELEEKVNTILDNLGLDPNGEGIEAPTEEVVEEQAKILADCIKNGTNSDNPVLQDILDDFRKRRQPFGLRYDIYNAIHNISKNGLDYDCIKYSTGTARVTALYFTTGVLHIAVHRYGSCIWGVGISLICLAIQNLGKAIQQIKAGTRSINPITQARQLTEGISYLYCYGKIYSLVIGMRHGPDHPLPLIAMGKEYYIAHDKVKNILFVSCLAAYTVLLLNGLASMFHQVQDDWNEMLDSGGFRDGDDLFAALVAIGVKLSILATDAETREEQAWSFGRGLLIPFGP